MIRIKRVYREPSLRDGIESSLTACGHGESARNVLASLNGEKTWRRARRSANGSDMNPPNGPSFAGDTERS